MSKFECPWCGKESEYEMVRRVVDYRYEVDPSSSILSKTYEKIECRCPSCKGTFNAIPKLVRYTANVFEPYVWKDSKGEEFTDYDLTSYEIDELREQYMIQEGYVEKKMFRQPSGGFSLPPASDKFALPPAQSKFSLSNLRRRRK